MKDAEMQAPCLYPSTFHNGVKGKCYCLAGPTTSISSSYIAKGCDCLPCLQITGLKSFKVMPSWLILLLQGAGNGIIY
jgi:hypothetical protein